MITKDGVDLRMLSTMIAVASRSMVKFEGRAQSSERAVKDLMIGPVRFISRGDQF